MKRYNHKGYVVIYNEETQKDEFEHRKVWKEHYGEIPDGMHIHHINEVRDDNRIENLQMVTPREHIEIYANYKIIAGQKHKPCRVCGDYKPVPDGYYKDRDRIRSMCKSCFDEQNKARHRAKRARNRAAKAKVA